MPEYSSKKQVQSALQKAREKFAAAKQAERAEKNEKKRELLADRSAQALKACQELQFVLDRWDSLHS
jgi:hypothetical protein